MVIRVGCTSRWCAILCRMCRLMRLAARRINQYCRQLLLLTRTYSSSWWSRQHHSVHTASQSKAGEELEEQSSSKRRECCRRGPESQLCAWRCCSPWWCNWFKLFRKDRRSELRWLWVENCASWVFLVAGIKIHLSSSLLTGFLNLLNLFWISSEPSIFVSCYSNKS